MRKILAITAALAVLSTSLFSGVASAATDTSLLNSGDKVNVSASSNTTTNVDTTTVNTAVVTQNSVVSNNSGNNVLSDNISLSNPCNPCGAVTGGGVGHSTGSNTAVVNQTATGINQNVVGVSVDANSQANNATGVVNTGNGVNVKTNDTVNTTVNTTAVNSAFVGQNSLVSNNSGLNVVDGNIGGTVAAVTGNNGAVVNQNVSDLNSNVVAVAIKAPTSTAGTDCMVCGVPCVSGTCTDITNTGDNLTVNAKSTTNTNVTTLALNTLWSTQNSAVSNNSGLNWMTDNIGGGALATGSNGAAVAQGVSGNSNVLGVMVGSVMPMGGSNLTNIVNTGASLTSNTTANDTTNANTTALNTLFGFQAQFSNGNSGFNLVAENIGGGVGFTGANAGGTTQALSGNNNAAVIGSDSLTLLAMMAMLL